ncbi:glucokinase [Chelativorans sp. Marseille-P2723]|uniref:glucokinase n=1 Tax=Chelativorans sp. Marseille-P2723 TaxID=2709133 RepID=UPI001570311B|nr:glucokinase [Chelativorans sp. Marseille-P2723]
MVYQTDLDAVLDFPILIGDIGGTNARFAIVVDSYAEPREFPVLFTADFPTIDDAIQSVLDQTSLLPRSTVLAVAGPVDGDEIDLTNSDWVVRPKQMMKTFGFGDVIVLNDFEAQALAVVALGEAHLEKIGGGSAETVGSRVVLGPGTGLGVAGLVHAQHTWIPLPGEGGHIDLGPRTERDYEIFPHLERIEGRISAEQVLCGRGLVNLYRAIAAADGKEAPFSDPAEITSAGLERSNPLATETLDLFVTYLGRVAGDLGLIFMSQGGVFLTGGIVQKIVPALRNGVFRAAFEDKAPHRTLMAEIPVYVITHPMAAVCGLGAYARTPGRFGVETAGRRWRAR